MPRIPIFMGSRKNCYTVLDSSRQSTDVRASSSSHRKESGQRLCMEAFRKVGEESMGISEVCWEALVKRNP